MLTRRYVTEKNFYHAGFVNFPPSFHQRCKCFAKCVAPMALGATVANGQGGHPQPQPPPAGAKAAKCKGRPIPQLEDVTAKTGTTFKHAAGERMRDASAGGEDCRAIRFGRIAGSRVTILDRYLSPSRMARPISRCTGVLFWR